jgi:hypothetical protein
VLPDLGNECPKQCSCKHYAALIMREKDMSRVLSAMVNIGMETTAEDVGVKTSNMFGLNI